MGYESVGSQRVRHNRSDLACMQCLSVNCILLIYPSPLSPLLIISLFSMSMSLFLFCK